MLTVTSTCPTCKTVYNITVLQLRVDQGKVCCFKCSNTFNAYLYLADQSKPKPNTSDISELAPSSSHPTLKIFEKKTNASNIDLQTYLNNTHSIKAHQIIPKLQRTSVKSQPFKGYYRSKKPSLSLLVVMTLSLTTFGLSILVMLAYALIDIA